MYAVGVITMTVRDYLLLCWMAYLDLPPLYTQLLQRGGRIPVAALADSTLRMDAVDALGCVKLNAPARAAAREMLNSDAVITGYINENDGDGFVAYVIDAGGETVIAMRGSETRSKCVASNVDWVDNVCEPFVGSVQLESIKRLADRFPEGNVTFTGHSKGGHNALAALAVSENPAARAVAFNGQGFGADALDATQRARLRERGVNYVVADDVVGALLMQPARRVFVRQAEGTQAHMPEAYTFDTSGAPLTARRTLKSRAVEAATRIVEKRLGGNARGHINRLCRVALGKS